MLAHGVGGLNIDACRVPSDEVTGWGGAGAGGGTWNSENMRLGKDGDARPVQGRFPANVLLEIGPRGNNKLVIIIFPCSRSSFIIHARIVLIGNSNTCVGI